MNGLPAARRRRFDPGPRRRRERAARSIIQAMAWDDVRYPRELGRDRRSAARRCGSAAIPTRSTDCRSRSSVRAPARRTRWPWPSAWRRSRRPRRVDRQRPGARCRFRGASRRAVRARADAGGARLGRRRHLSARARGAGARTSRAPARSSASSCPARRRIRAILPAAQPHHQRPVARRGGRRSGREERIAHHRAMRARSGARCARGARRHPERPKPGRARAAQGRRKDRRVGGRYSWKSWGWPDQGSGNRPGDPARQIQAGTTARFLPRARPDPGLPDSWRTCDLDTISERFRPAAGAAAAAVVRARDCRDSVRRDRRRPVRPGLTVRARVVNEEEQVEWQNHWSWSNRRQRRRPSINISGAITRSSRRWATSAICRRASSASTSTTTSPRPTSRSASRKKVIKELKDAAKDATDIYVATDPDREGEAIGWHLIAGARPARSARSTA